MDSSEKELKNHTIALMIGTAIFFDALQWLLVWIFMGWLAGFFAGLTFYVWFKIHGMKFMSPKRIATMGGAFLIEIVPILSTLPAWTGAVVILILDYKAKRLLGADAKPTFQKGPPLPRRPRRPTREDWRYAREITSTSNIRPLLKQLDYEPQRPSTIERPPRTSRILSDIKTPEVSVAKPPINQTALPQTSVELSGVQPVGTLLEKDSRGKIIDQDINLNNLVFVRADSHLPKITSEGPVIESAHDASGGKTKRLTNHFTLNHSVASNIGGNWDKAPYTFITPAKEMVAANGKPDNLYSVDSFWAKSVKLPKGSVVVHEPGKKPDFGQFTPDYIFVEAEPGMTRKETVSRVLKQMNYTEISGEGRHSEDGFDKSVGTYAGKEGVRSGLHEFSWSEIWEDSHAFLQDNKPIKALELVRYLSSNPEESARMPEGVKKELVRDIFNKIAQTDLSENGRVTGIMQNVIGEKSPDQKLVLENTPASVWSGIKERMLSKVGELDGYDSKEEAVAEFEGIFTKPYEEIMGKRLPVE